MRHYGFKLGLFTHAAVFNIHVLVEGWDKCISVGAGYFEK
jgi:hypothetical protein